MSAARAGPSSRTPLLQAATHHSHSHSHSRPSHQSRNLSPIPAPISHRPEHLRDPYQSFGETGRSTSPDPSIPNSKRPWSKRHRRRTPPLPLIPTIILLIIAALLIFAAWDVSSIGNCTVPWICKALGKGKARKEEIYIRNTGAYAPYRSWGDGGGGRGLPRGCLINQVNILHRHAARYPTTSSAKRLQTVLTKLQNRHTARPSKRYPELTFLEKADLTMEGWRVDELTDQGRKAAWRSGKEARTLYKRLVEEGNTTFYRAGGSDRVIETGQYWRSGFIGKPFKIQNTTQLPSMDVIIPEEDNINNTLSVHNCGAYEQNDDKEGYENPRYASLISQLTRATERLNTALRPQPKLEIMDIVYLADICAFDSQARGTDWMSWSEWCGIYTRKEWEILGYLRDAERYYHVGQGSRFGATMGAGWVNELIARLTDSFVVDNTTTNRTLDSDPETFPMGGHRIFADFSHDNEMIQIMTALGIIPQNRDLSLKKLPRKRTYQLSSLIPFGAKLVVERIGCDLGNWEPDPEEGSGGSQDGRKDYVRILINDKIYSIQDVNCQQSGFVEHGMCEVAAFVDSQVWAREDVDWGICNGISEEAL